MARLAESYDTYIADNGGFTTAKPVILSGTAATLAVGGTLTVTGAQTFTGVATFTNTPVFSAGVNSKRNVQTDVSAATIAVAAAQSGSVFLATKGSATQTYTLPAVAAGLWYTFICGDAAGEILIDSTSSDDIIVTTFAAVGTDADTAIVTTTSTTGIKNTAGSNAVGDSVTVVSDGVKWYGVGITSGVWAAQ